ncbi:BON domain-containing protein [Piscinibacter sakaiensis]|uniref:Uncharacterized protein n=1 Tax=Piscinibacter sakaiensis TaxID=1547922 RepID=A0A0K8NXX3_PISS1|nr:BON domain-containing protein [Piscinibacter sakaiensis]GAP35252.1 hypothetical protein ISF6_0843 [Piscinibacter sakaiensis]
MGNPPLRRGTIANRLGPEVRPPQVARQLVAAVAALAYALPLAAGGADEALRNGYDDPHFRATRAIAGCPVPAGPYATEAELRAQAHRRAEKGTSCWLADDPSCTRANAYAYDREIAEHLRQDWRAHRRYADSSLWITVQGRVVYVEGCVARADDAARIEAAVRRLPHVQQAIAIVTTRPRQPPPYRTRPAPPSTP